jgi:hypothetical protein
MLFLLGSQWLYEALTTIDNWRTSTDVTESETSSHQIREFYKNDLKPNGKCFILFESGNVRTAGENKMRWSTLQLFC